MSRRLWLELRWLSTLKYGKIRTREPSRIRTTVTVTHCFRSLPRFTPFSETVRSPVVRSVHCFKSSEPALKDSKNAGIDSLWAQPDLNR